MENEILNLFLFNHNLKFSEIEKSLKTRSNKISYHLKSLVRKGILEKDSQNYKLSKTSEHLIPYLSREKAVLPVILILVEKDKRVFLYKREKRPYKNKLSLPGGRILMTESVEDAARRIMKQKFNIGVKFKKINSISLEQVKKEGKIIHSFFLIFVSAETNQKIPLTKIENNKTKIIPSDYYLIKNKTKEQTNINRIYSKI